MTALGGNYVNFGVFELYGDRALADVLDITLKMTLSIPLADIFAYRKVKCRYICKSIFSFLFPFVLCWPLLDGDVFMITTALLEL